MDGEEEFNVTVLKGVRGARDNTPHDDCGDAELWHAVHICIAPWITGKWYDFDGINDDRGEVLGFLNHVKDGVVEEECHSGKVINVKMYSWAGMRGEFMQERVLV